MLRRDLLSTFGIAAGAITLRRARAQTAKGAPAWNVKGVNLWACPCEVSCDCDFGSAPTAGFCTVIIGYHIESGRYGDVTLDGLNAARVVHSPGHMAKGHFRVAFYLDERADAAQREALSAIFSVKASGAFASEAKAVDQDLGARFVPIVVETKGRQRKLSIGGIADADITAIPGRNGKEVVIDNLPDDAGLMVVGKSTRTAYKDYDLQLDVKGKSGGHAPFAYSST